MQNTHVTCDFWMHEIHFLGYVVDYEGIKLNLINIDLVIDIGTMYEPNQNTNLLGFGEILPKIHKKTSLKYQIS